MSEEEFDDLAFVRFMAWVVCAALCLAIIACVVTAS